MIKKFLNISLIKTIRINYHYFGIGGVLRSYILCSKHVLLKELHGNVTLDRKERGIVRIGFGEVEVIDGKYNRAIWSNAGNIVFKGDAHFCQGSKIIVKEAGEIVFGNHFIQNGDTELISRKRITFGSDVLLSWGCLIMDMDFHKIFHLNNTNAAKINADMEILIGNHCWIGANSTILKGVVLGDNVIVGAGSIIRRTHKENNVILVDDSVVEREIYWSY